MPREAVVDRLGKDAFYATGLGDLLKENGIRHLGFAEVTTEVRVQTTMGEANDGGYDCILATGATESYRDTGD